MRFAIWQSVDYSDCALGYKPGALMEHVWIGEIKTDPAMHQTQILDRIFIDFQRVEEGEHWPPAGYKGRSLSVGDVVQLEIARGRYEWWSCEMIGWLQTEEITNMACSYCNAAWPEGARSCPSCGMTIEDVAETLKFPQSIHGSDA